MKIFTTLFLLLSFNINAQEVKKIITNDFLDTKTIEQSTNPLTFRIYNVRQYIDISIGADSVVTGNIINFTWPCPNKDCSIPDYNNAEMYMQTIALSAPEADSVLQLIKKHNVLQMRSGDDIEEWPDFLDGSEFTIYQNVNGIYTKKSYDTPYNVRGINEADQINAFNEELNRILKLENLHSKFLWTIGPGNYTQGYYLISLRRKRWWKFWMW
jgi:hypothetical protein